VLPGLARGMRQIVFEYPYNGRRYRSVYNLSRRLLPELVPGTPVPLLIDPKQPDRPILRDLFR
jgi:hypothetical protein